MSAFISLLNQHQLEFVEYFGQRLSPDVRRAMAAMTRCRTQHPGCAHWHCPQCQHHQLVPLSCGHRNCPQCQHRTTEQWLARQQVVHLPTATFMVTLTLPAQLRALAQRHPKALYQQMFTVAASLMKDFAQRKHGGLSGFTVVLHTHSPRRACHPHLHVLVPAGHFDKRRRQWHKGHKGFLYSARALAKVWRARMLDALHRHPQLFIPDNLPTHWVVDCRYIGRGPSVLKYLPRYLYRGVLPESDIVDVSQGAVTFRYRDGHTQAWRHRTLPVLRFLWLILQRVLPKGLQRVRSYGLLHSSAKEVRQQLQLLLLAQGMTPQPTMTLQLQAQWRCPCCQQPCAVSASHRQVDREAVIG